MDEPGAEIYKIEFNATVKFKKDSYNPSDDNSFHLYENPKPLRSLDGWGHKTLFKKGDKITLQGSVVLEKADNGWRPIEHYSLHLKKQ